MSLRRALAYTVIWGLVFLTFILLFIDLGVGT